MPYPPPGELVNIGTHQLHLHCAGEGTPTVVFDAALGASSLSWALVAPAIAQVTRACVYDRAGFGWSDPGPLPRTAGRIAGELRMLLQRASVPPPYILVGHSFGGFVVRLFATRHRADVAGLVFVEPAHPEEWIEPNAEQRELLARGATLCRYGVAAARLGAARVVAALVGLGALGPARAMVKLVSRGGLKREDEGVLAPIWKLPPSTRAMVSQAWTQPKFFEALGSQIASMPASAAETAAEADVDFGDLPVTVLTGMAASDRRKMLDAALARRSARGRHVLVPDTGHWIPLDAPDAVVGAIKEMLERR